MYELYIGNKNYSSWSLRPWVLMSELGIAFAEHVVAFDPGTSWTKFRAFSPSGKVPCLVDGGTVVWDSLGITEYLAERHAGVWPGDAVARAWARCAAAEMHSGFSALRNTCSMNCGLRVRLHEISPALQRDLDRTEELWLEGLRRFAGRVPGADLRSRVEPARHGVRGATARAPVDARLESRRARRAMARRGARSGCARRRQIGRGPASAAVTALMAVPRFPRAWIAYAALLTAAVVIGEFGNILRGEPVTWLMAANWVVTLALLTATWGYAMQRPIGNAIYWRRVFWILLVASALMLVRVAAASTTALVLVLGFMVVLLPAYVAAFRYGFRSPHLWS
jgi:glutathione S-transferase